MGSRSRAIAANDQWKHLRSRRDRDLLEELRELTRSALAVALEKAVNGTSLVLSFEVGDAVLLFPADAQWGTWRRHARRRRGREPARAPTFCKVGHHGSHNATPTRLRRAAPRRAADGDDEKLWSMVSTRSDQWDDVPHEIPRRPLLDAVATVADFLARSDLPAEAPDAGFARHDEQVTEALVPI